MSAKQVYEVKGEVVSNLKEVAAILGVERVSRKDVLEGGAYADQVNMRDLVESAEASSTEDTEPMALEAGPLDIPTVGDSPLDIPTVGDEDSKDSAAEATEMEGPTEVEETTEVPVEEATSSGTSLTPEDARKAFPDFGTLEDLKSFIKDIDTPTLEYMASSLGCTWDHSYHPSIERMRIAQALHRSYFPGLVS